MEEREKVNHGKTEIGVKGNNFIFGSRAVIEAIDAGKEIEKVLIQKNLNNDLIKELTGKIKAHKIPYVRVPLEKLNRFTRRNHQGVISYISPIHFHALDHIIEQAFSKGRDPLLVILDRITDVRNFGAIARTMECAGADAIVIPSRGGALVGGDAMKTSAGALNLLPVCREENLKNTINYLKTSGIRVIGCTEKTNRLIYGSSLHGPIAIIMGSEENGISGEYLKLCDELVKIPMNGKIESLNVSVSTGIVLYEVLRQRNYSGNPSG
ncbi:MAG: 23S rRNA (guanosine(2251)-2'-O)-methyltransferase RlmB [Cytophagales bacterium]|nr:23S rRNA (guanosine(2251)-2'-O)-methyltransferase RlmB [Cytophagales bacterium]